MPHRLWRGARHAGTSASTRSIAPASPVMSPGFVQAPATGLRNHFSTPAVVADHDRCAGEQRFEGNQAEDFVARGVDDDVCGGQRVQAIATGEQADEADAS